MCRPKHIDEFATGLTREIILAGTTVQYASTATQRSEVASNMTITADEIKQAVRTLKQNNAQKITEMIDPSNGVGTQPVDAAFIAFVPEHQLRPQGPHRLHPRRAVRQRKALPGESGALDEVRFIESTNSKVFEGAGASSIDVYGTLIIGQEYYAQSRVAGEALRNIIKPLGSAGSADPLDQRQTSGWRMYVQVTQQVAEVLMESQQQTRRAIENYFAMDGNGVSAAMRSKSVTS